MRDDRRGSWAETRCELGQMAWAVLLIDVMAVGLGALYSRHTGAFALKVGIVVAGFVTLCFVVLIAGSLGVESVVHWWLVRRAPRHTSRPPDEKL